MWRRMALDAQSRNEIKGVLRDAFAAWIERSGDPEGCRLLVVFIDDLDRCASERIVEVCEAIKLYLDVPGIVFVLGCDQSALWRAVRDSAGIGEPADAVEYLEKIIQINYRIPVPSAAHALRLVNGYLERSHTHGLFDDSMKNVIIERSGRNPRRIKRLINSFVLEYHLNRSWDEVGVENLVKVIMLQHFYPGFFQILTNPRHDDPITEFLRYNEFRSAVLRDDEVNLDGWTVMFHAKGLKPPRGDKELEGFLTNLEKELPAEFPTLAADRDFVALIASFDGDGIDTNRLRQLLRRPLTAADRAAEDVMSVDLEITSTMLNAVGKIVPALESTPEAVIVLGNMLIVKAGGVVTIYMLTAPQLELIVQQPNLLRSPDEALKALGLSGSAQAGYRVN
jgi:hypothetical protein